MNTAAPLIYGKEHTFLDEETGLLFRNSSLAETASAHTHTFYEVFAVTHGTALHMINGTIQTLYQGDLVFIRPNDIHSYGFHYSSDFRIMNIGFSSLIFDGIKAFLSADEAFRSLEIEALPPTVHLKEEEMSQIIDSFSLIGKDMQSESAKNTVMHAKCILAYAICLFLQSSVSTSAADTAYPSWFNNMLIEMDKLENIQIGFDRMLDLSACTSNHLCRIFRKYKNQTPTEYINQKRLDYAVYYLSQTDDEIFTISENCGFHNLSHLYHLFRQKYNCSPAKYRRRHRSNNE